MREWVFVERYGARGRLMTTCKVAKPSCLESATTEKEGGKRAKGCSLQLGDIPRQYAVEKKRWSGGEGVGSLSRELSDHRL